MIVLCFSDEQFVILQIVSQRYFFLVNKKIKTAPKIIAQEFAGQLAIKTILSLIYFSNKTKTENEQNSRELMKILVNFIKL